MKSQDNIIITDAPLFKPDDIGDFVKIPREGGYSFAVITDIGNNESDLLFFDPFHEENGIATFESVSFMTDQEGKIVSAKKGRPAIEVLLEWRNNNQTVLNAAIAKYGSSSESILYEKLKDSDALCIKSRSSRKNKLFLPVSVALNQVREFYRPSHKWMKGVRNDIFHRDLVKHLAYDENGALRFLPEWGPNVREIAPGIWRFPLFSPEYCQWLIKTASDLGFWKKERGDQYGAMETRLSTISPWLDATHTQIIAGHFIYQICSAVFTNWRIQQCEEPFIIKYCESIDTIHTHCDGNSSLTMLVHLDGAGGGTSFPNLGLDITDMSSGEALLFCGGAPLYEHRSLPSTDRHVLVYWMN